MKSLVPWKSRKSDSGPMVWNDWIGGALDWPVSRLGRLFDTPFPAGSPSIDVSDGKDEVTVRVEVPGMRESDIDVTWHNGVLRIRGEKKHEQENKRGNALYRECSYGSFSRDVYLGDRVNWDGAKARYKHGVLTVSLPKTDQAKKTIEIKVN